ncbi:hypothetical protein EVAR_32750_1 [Eumeta japonica]|uniref:Uncharacterized protein n=1 Tax=Eumeta variegata TaxID=151549 RepID=A0A4C1XNL1_EUMVA|nr:hypothetical protein EVAR_32750_1 [Eumeta japonica]
MLSHDKSISAAVRCGTSFDKRRPRFNSSTDCSIPPAPETTTTTTLYDIAYKHRIAAARNCVCSNGILLWGHATDIHRIFVLQKRTVRAVYKLGPRASLRRITVFLGTKISCCRFKYHEDTQHEGRRRGGIKRASRKTKTENRCQVSTFIPLHGAHSYGRGIRYFKHALCEDIPRAECPRGSAPGPPSSARTLRT